MDIHRSLFYLLTLAFILGFAVGVGAQGDKVTLRSKASFTTVAAALEKAIADHGMGLVCRANAQHGAATRGVKIAGNQVFMVFRNDFAVRLINADPQAAYEAPIRIYLYENKNGTATLVYAKASSLFRPYGHPEVIKVGAELDLIFERISRQAVAAQ